jgi:hypothetical protein
MSARSPAKPRHQRQLEIKLLTRWMHISPPTALTAAVTATTADASNAQRLGAVLAEADHVHLHRPARIF